MDTLVSIGEFSKMTYLSVKALRHYDDVGLLEPAAVDPTTGYRRYAARQVPIAHAIRRFRELEMPLEEIRLVLNATDAPTRNRVLLEHLEHMQHQLEQTQLTVASLQTLLSGELHAEGRVEIRRLAAVEVLAETSSVAFNNVTAWLEPTLSHLHSRAQAAGLVVCGADGALYSDQFFEAWHGDVTAFIPVVGDAVTESVVLLEAQTVALLVHEGSFGDLDRTYGALGTIVAERGIDGRGPVREHYLSDTQTEVCWPVTTGDSV